MLSLIFRIRISIITNKSMYSIRNFNFLQSIVDKFKQILVNNMFYDVLLAEKQYVSQCSTCRAEHIWPPKFQMWDESPKNLTLYRRKVYISFKILSIWWIYVKPNPTHTPLKLLLIYNIQALFNIFASSILAPKRLLYIILLYSFCLAASRFSLLLLMLCKLITCELIYENFNNIKQ